MPVIMSIDGEWTKHLTAIARLPHVVRPSAQAGKGYVPKIPACTWYVDGRHSSSHELPVRTDMVLIHFDYSSSG